MRIGIIKETKTPVDNRVALTPSQIKALKEKFPHAEFKVQSSNIRAYSDAEYSNAGIEVCDNIDDCDFLLGIKEADIHTLVPGKHYMFFGHIAKMQPYNKPLFKSLIENKNTFSDYEYLVDDNNLRLVAFGWYAGVVGMYYTLRGYGLRRRSFELPKPHTHFTLEELIGNLRNAPLGDIKVIITGTGRVSQGAQYVLEQIGAKKLSPEDFLIGNSTQGLVYCVLGLKDLVANNETGMPFNREDFANHPENYHSIFMPYAKSADILVSGHFWNNNQPIYISKEDLRNPDLRISMIGDVTCDIQGSIQSTLRPSTHDKPYYDYNPVTEKEEPAFSNAHNISVMAVDTCPNALPRVTSDFFGNKLIEFVLNDMLEKGNDSTVILDRATILKNGELTPGFSYLSEYVKTL